MTDTPKNQHPRQGSSPGSGAGIPWDAGGCRGVDLPWGAEAGIPWDKKSLGMQEDAGAWAASGMQEQESLGMQDVDCP